MGGAASSTRLSGSTGGSVPGLRGPAFRPADPKSGIAAGPSVMIEEPTGTGRGSRHWPRVFVVNVRDAEDVCLRANPRRDSAEVRGCGSRFMRVCVGISRKRSHRGRTDVSVS